MNTRIFHRFFGVILWMGIATTLFAQPKNILYLRFEQKHISRAIPIAEDSIFSVYYRLSCPKPSKLHGIAITFSYDKTILAPVDKGAIIVGSASANAEWLFSTVNAKIGQNRVEILSNQMFDTSNHLLFRFRATVLTKASVDSAAISVSPIKLDDLGIDHGIDSVVVENAAGIDDAGFFPFAIAYLDSIKVVHQKHQLTLHSDSLFIPSDSTKTLSIILDSVSVTNIQTASFSAHYDASRIEVLSIDKGAILNGTTITTSVKGDSISASFSTTRLENSGEVFRLRLKAKRISDTIETTLRNPKFTVSNPDDSILTILCDLKPITIYGFKDSVVDTTHSTVSQLPEKYSSILLRGGKRILIRGIAFDSRAATVYSITGAKVARLQSVGNVLELPAELLQGMYLLSIENPKELLENKSFFFIVH